MWTPAGELIVAGPSGMFRVSADGGSPRQLFPDRQGVFVDLVILPSGRHLLFRQLGGETGLHVLDLTSGEIRRLEWTWRARPCGRRRELCRARRDSPRAEPGVSRPP